MTFEPSNVPSAGSARVVGAEGLSVPPLVPTQRVRFSLVEALLNKPSSRETSGVDFSEQAYLSKVKEATALLFPGQAVQLPDAPTAGGAFGTVYRFEVDGVAYRLKAAAHLMLDAYRGMSLTDLTSGELPELTREYKGLLPCHPQTPRLVGIVSDSARVGEPTYNLGLVTRWEEGPQLIDALQSGVLSAQEAKEQLRNLMSSMVERKIYYMDLQLSNFVLRTHSPDDGARLAEPEIVAVDMGLWDQRYPIPDEQFLRATCGELERLIDQCVRRK